MNPTTRAGGQARQTLAWQIDRLDRILDGLSDGLNEAVAAAMHRAVAETVGGAVKAAVTEVLRDAKLQCQPHLVGRAAGYPASTARLPCCITGGAGLVAAGPAPCARWAWAEAVRLAARCRQAERACLAAAARLAWVTWAKGRELAGLAYRRRWALAAAAGVGLAVGVGCYLAGPVVGATVSGLAGAVASLAARWLNSLRRAVSP